MELAHAALLVALVVLVAAAVGYALHLRRCEPARCATLGAETCAGTVATLHEVRGANPCLVVRARLGDHQTLFCVDTGFAGPCLLSMPCLALESGAEVVSVEEACEARQRALAGALPSSVAQEAALQRFIARNRCSDFTAGCTMRLASIGSTKEQTSEMILAPPLELETPEGRWTAPRACSGQPVAEVLTSTAMPTVHLLTCDWLTQNAPALLCPALGVLRTNLTPEELAAERGTLRSASTELSGGAFVATVYVDGIPLRVTVDTGAACYLSVGAQAASKLSASRESQSTTKTMRQIGANGERICATAVYAHVEMCGAGASDVPVLVNNLALDGEDGYVGLCFLRHFDLCVTRRELFARRNAAAFDVGLLDGLLSDQPCA